MGFFLRGIQLISPDLLHQRRSSHAKQVCGALHHAIGFNERLVNNVLLDRCQVSLQVQAFAWQVNPKAGGNRIQAAAQNFCRFNRFG